MSDGVSDDVCTVCLCVCMCVCVWFHMEANNSSLLLIH